MSSPLNATEGGSRRPMKRKSRATSSTPRAKKKRIEPEQLRPFLFLSLPPEIRNIVYELAFARPAGIDIAGRHESYTVKHSKFLWQRKDVRHLRAHTRRGNLNDRIPVSFLRCCKRVNSEARTILYANRFRVDDMETLAVWLRDLGPGNIVYLRRIQIRTEPQPWSSRVSRRVEVQQSRYRDVCRKVAKMIAAAKSLEFLQTVFYYHHKIKFQRSSLQRPGPVSGWIDLARKVAELLYDDFRPIFSQGLSRGRSPEQLCRILDVGQNNWWGRRHSLTPSQLNATDAEHAENESEDVILAWRFRISTFGFLRLRAKSTVPILPFCPLEP
ncbi:uncharacterized protein LY79DRAFT_584844 [Colletotrichum navitas]|uniref:DUF7730 domain-containing protein n=1 Tax=Colletotrichum navitas TaxID=681940 RepID=A0AAD8PK72_9PEZI|nr:uncharacterized protein LY79DRAFT_584844 [Colletotrichum navitas]KAK1566370.1 hypothetical protein LY79DRAFT_584844 [Colletotrichum navitas]